ncbi:hypothetical protein [Acinetobacter lactucae]|uniref:hypothetical protein n=1 Tax=Acinetobacter lactucae TaxID=1785128 RepID=UPI0007073256|nr:hypothetical protein [Acinetobacter lactucae]KQE94012.1 hypothetical protein APB94_10195 [Acinetobacter lactucae]
MTALGFSSEYYHVKIEELLQLSDSKLDLQLKDKYPHIQADDVILFIGKDSKNIADNLFQGRDILLHAQKQGLTHFPTLIMFEQRAPQLGILALLKPIRKKYLDFSTQSYEIALSDIIDNHLERNLKTEETAYNYSDRNKWGVPKDQRQSRFHDIDMSFKEHGYDKKHPMAIMLCRGLGVKDKLHQGHHRMFFCRKYNIPYIQVQFLATNSFSGPLKTFFLWLNKTLKYKQVN